MMPGQTRIGGWGISIPAYTGVYNGKRVLDERGIFVRFGVNPPTQWHTDYGYWKFETDEDDQRAFAHDLPTPESVLRERLLNMRNYDKIKIVWIPGIKDTTLQGPGLSKKLVASAGGHIAQILQLWKLLGMPVLEMPVPFDSATPTYPVGTDARLREYWRPIMAARAAQVQQGQSAEVSLETSAGTIAEEEQAPPATSLPPGIIDLTAQDDSSESSESVEEQTYPVEAQAHPFEEHIQPVESPSDSLASNDAELAKLIENMTMPVPLPDLETPYNSASSTIDLEGSVSQIAVPKEAVPEKTISESSVSEDTAQEDIIAEESVSVSEVSVPEHSTSSTHPYSSLEDELFGFSENDGVSQPQSSPDYTDDTGAHPDDGRETSHGSASGSTSPVNSTQPQTEAATASTGIPSSGCPKCGEPDWHTAWCQLGLSRPRPFTEYSQAELDDLTDTLAATEALTSATFGEWQDKYVGNASSQKGSSEEQIQKMVKVIKEEDSYKNDPVLQCLEGEALVLAWAFRKQDGAEKEEWEFPAGFTPEDWE